MIKKILKYFLVLILIAIILNIPVATRQGINYKVRTLKIPFYIKVIEFLNRDYHYRKLAREITADCTTDKEKVIEILDWVTKNIHKIPEGFDVVDDHLQNIIIRRYGAPDQMADVFTTLASYAGYEALWEKLRSGKASEPLILSFVKINATWHMFDVYNKRPFISGKARELSTGYGATYNDYLKELDSSKLDSLIKRPDKQKIIPRLIFELKKAIRKRDIKK